MADFMRELTIVAVGVSLCATSTSAIAVAPAAPVSVATATITNAPTTVSPWVALSGMSGSSAAAAAAITAQDDYVAEGSGFPPIPVLAVILATLGVGIWIAVHEGGGDIEVDISPD